MMEYRLTITMGDLGRDEANGVRILDGFVKAHPETGPVVGQNLRSGDLDVTFSLDAADAPDAFARGADVLAAGLLASVPPVERPKIVGVHVDAAGLAELQPA